MELNRNKQRNHTVQLNYMQFLLVNHTLTKLWINITVLIGGRLKAGGEEDDRG